MSDQIELIKKFLPKIEKSLQSEKTEELNLLQRQEIKERETDLALKKKYANWFIGILMGQLLIMNIIFVFTGLEYLNFDKWVLQLYMGGTLAEVFGVVYIITKHLFPKK